MDTDRLKILISNDDGLDSEGLLELANVLSPWCELTVVVPDGQRSASSHAITLHKPVRLYKIEEIAPGAATYISSGSPTDCVVLGLDHLMKEDLPDLVLSGINKGGNTAEDVSYSGTVAAAIEGAICRVPSVAISLLGKEPKYFNVAALAALGLVCHIASAIGKELSGKAQSMVPANLMPSFLGDGAKPEWDFKLVNVNVPDLPEGRIKGWKPTSLGRRDYKDIVVMKNDPHGNPYYWIAGEKVITKDPEGSDLRAVQDGYISITPLLLDYTDYKSLKGMEMAQ